MTDYMTPGSWPAHDYTVKYLEQIRLGRTPYIEQCDDGFEIRCDGYFTEIVLDGHTYILNELLIALSFHYRRLTSLLGDPSSPINQRRLAGFTESNYLEKLPSLKESNSTP